MFSCPPHDAPSNSITHMLTHVSSMDLPLQRFRTVLFHSSQRRGGIGLCFIMCLKRTGWMVSKECFVPLNLHSFPTGFFAWFFVYKVWCESCWYLQMISTILSQLCCRSDSVETNSCFLCGMCMGGCGIASDLQILTVSPQDCSATQHLIHFGLLEWNSQHQKLQLRYCNVGVYIVESHKAGCSEKDLSHDSGCTWCHTWILPIFSHIFPMYNEHDLQHGAKYSEKLVRVLYSAVISLDCTYFWQCVQSFLGCFVCRSLLLQGLLPFVLPVQP